MVAGNAGLMLLLHRMIYSEFPLTRYLERIGLGSPPDPDEAGLRKIHSAQAFSIPFENIDIHLGRTISLNLADLVSKILERKRGGYCFELNGILGMALTAAGFSVQEKLARVLYDRTGPGARTHEVLIAAISGRKWLADCGFGAPGLRLPMQLVPDLIQEQDGDRFRLRRDPGLGLVLQKETKDSFLDLYCFQESELTLGVDIDMANHFTSTWPGSKFRLHRICCIPKPWGRVTLMDMELTTYRNGQSSSRTLAEGPEYMAAIAEHFGIHIDAQYQDLIPLDMRG